MSSSKKRELYALFDKKVGAYRGVKDYGDVVEMSRDFEVLVRNMDKKYYMANHLDEYAVYRVGYFDDETGEVEKIQPVSVLELCSFSEQ